jgi:hypothetical protein
MEQERGESHPDPFSPQAAPLKTTSSSLVLIDIYLSFYLIMKIKTPLELSGVRT